MRTAILFACLLLMAAACSDQSGKTDGGASSATPKAARVPQVLTERVREILAAPESFELLTLYPNNREIFDPTKDSRPHLHGVRITGRAEVSEGERKQLVDELYASIEASNGQRAICFYPRHGIVAKKGADLLELIVAFECYHTQIYLNGELLGVAEHTKFGRELFNLIGIAHDLPTHGSSFNGD